MLDVVSLKYKQKAEKLYLLLVSDDDDANQNRKEILPSQSIALSQQKGFQACC